MGDSSVDITQDGYPMGYLDGFTIDKNGRVVGVFSNGLTRNIAQVAVATVNNPAGLERVGETMFRVSSNSGTVRINPAGVRATARSPGALEMSTSTFRGFTDMIIATGFEPFQDNYDFR